MESFFEISVGPPPLLSIDGNFHYCFFGMVEVYLLTNQRWQIRRELKTPPFPILSIKYISNMI